MRVDTSMYVFNVFVLIKIVVFTNKTVICFTISELVTSPVDCLITFPSVTVFFSSGMLGH